MIFAEVMLGAPAWLALGLVSLGVAIAFLVWSYRGPGATPRAKSAAAILKTLGIAALGLCLVDPLYRGTRPRPGSNLMLLVADDSRSLRIHDEGRPLSRGEETRALLGDPSAWRTRLTQDFDTRKYAFDAQPRPIEDFSSLSFAGDDSALVGSLASLAERYRGRPLAGILLFTDGGATDLEAEGVDLSALPPVYPVVLGADAGLIDVSLSRVSVSQTNFEAAPVTIAAEVTGLGIVGRRLVVRVLDEALREVESRVVIPREEGRPLVERFQLRPEKPGVSFYVVKAHLEGEEEKENQPGESSEATLENNRRIAVIDRGRGPYRVLYVGGRPNWEFKFLRRALTADEELALVGLVRIAKREPKFTFRGRTGEKTNPIFRGFGAENDEEAEQYDQPVLIRLGTENAEELRGGFPKSAEDLFKYHAVVLDDVESAFFTREQMSLMQRFVGQRGGGFLMLGGAESFERGDYRQTPIGELLPVYLDRGAPADAESEASSGAEGEATADAPSGAAVGASNGGYRLSLTREGWLQPWVRLRATEQDETRRLAEMPEFQTMNASTAIKPGATVLANVESYGGLTQPALVVQPFGRGRSSALLVGDLWRWQMRRPEGAQNDLEMAWRQTVRWLVADVPGRVEVETDRPADAAARTLRLTTLVRDEKYEPLDNAQVTLQVTTPDGSEFDLTADPDDGRPGAYRTTFSSREPGAYRAMVRALAADSSPVGQREIGWAIEPSVDEFRSLTPNRELLSNIARETGGELIDAKQLDRFVASLPNRKIPVVESWTYPLWHRWTVLLVAVCLLAGEWSIRRLRGMP